MNYSKLMSMGYGERGLVIRVCLTNSELSSEVRKMFNESKNFDKGLSESAICRSLSEVFCLSEESVERCVKGSEINCRFHSGRNNDK